MNGPTSQANQPHRQLRTGLIVAIVLHACLAVMLVVIPFRVWYTQQGAGADGGSTAEGQNSPERASPPPQPEKESISPEAAKTAEKVMTAQVETQLRQAIVQGEQLSDDEKLSQLDQLAGKLDRVASEKSVDELSKKFQAWLKTEPRTTAPAETPVAGEFDYSTAQFHDVTREELPEGGYRYKSVLLDAAGRTREVELTAAEGETAYKTLSLLKGHPLADKLYRQVTMPLLDKLIRSAEAPE